VRAAACNAAAQTRDRATERRLFRKAIPHLRSGTSRRGACGMTHFIGVLSPAPLPTPFRLRIGVRCATRAQRG